MSNGFKLFCVMALMAVVAVSGSKGQARVGVPEITPHE
jgi:hypothetical protein